MAEWSKAAVSKTVNPLSRVLGFESPSLRKANAAGRESGRLFWSSAILKASFQSGRKLKRPVGPSGLQLHSALQGPRDERKGM